jgi:hypothetical protein
MFSGGEPPGSLTERQTAMLDFLEKGTTTQPSLLFKHSDLPNGRISADPPGMALAKRIDTMEAIFEGTVQGGPFAARTERLITKLSRSVLAAPVEIPASTCGKDISRPDSYGEQCKGG